MKNIAKTALFLLPFLFVSCSSGGNDTPVTPSSDFALDVTSITLNEEDTHQFVPSGVTDEHIVFYTVRDDSVASVSESGLLTALCQGETVVTAQYGSQTALCSVTVLPYEPDEALSIVLDKTSFTLSEGDEYDLPIKVMYGDEYVTDYSLTAEISDPSVISFSDGTVTGLDAGNADVLLTASYQGETASLLIHVEVLG